VSEPPKPPTLFSRYRARASDLAGSPEKVAALARAATRKLANVSRMQRRFRAVTGELSTFVALLKAWVSGDYRRVSTRAIVTVIAAVLYFVVPVDLIPGVIAAVGLLDDAAVIGYVIAVVRDEIAEFESWLAGRAKEGS